MDQFKLLSNIRVADDTNLIHDQVAPCVEGEDDGLGLRGAVESDQGAVSAVKLAECAIDMDPVDDNARIFNLQDECGQGVCALGDGGGTGNCGCGSGSGNSGGGWNDANARASTRVSSGT